MGQQPPQALPVTGDQSTGIDAHTPGPWRATNDVDNVVYDPVTHLGIAYTWGDGLPFLEDAKQRQANARLIAAAPDMLAALHAAHDFLDKHGNGWDEADALDIIRAAIAKAEGRS